MGALEGWITWATWVALEDETWEAGWQVSDSLLMNRDESQFFHVLNIDMHLCCCNGKSELTLYFLHSDMYRSGMSGMDRDFGHSDMTMNRGFGDSFGGMGT